VQLHNSSNGNPLYLLGRIFNSIIKNIAMQNVSPRTPVNISIIHTIHDAIAYSIAHERIIITREITIWYFRGFII